MINCHIFSLAVPARENMWQFIMFRENINHISRKTKTYHLSILYNYLYYMNKSIIFSGRFTIH
jgi:hypothetical protein